MTFFTAVACLVMEIDVCAARSVPQGTHGKKLPHLPLQRCKVKLQVYGGCIPAEGGSRIVKKNKKRIIILSSCIMFLMN